MKALVFDGQSEALRLPRLIYDREIPTPLPGEARIRTTLTGICNTDLEVLRGYTDFSGVLGHEFVGIVDQAEDDELLGRRVVGEISTYCDTCKACRTGRSSHCLNRTVLGVRERDGTLAEYFCLPIKSLHVVPDSVLDEAAIFAEPLAAACQILEQVHMRPSDRVIVLGDGKLGLLVAQVLALTGCDLLTIGHHPQKLSTLTVRGIATRQSAEGLDQSADVVVDCTGQAGGFQTARRLVHPRGTIVLKSTYRGQVDADLSGLVVSEIQIVGSRCGPFPAALRLLEQNLIDVKSLIEAEYPLDEALAAFEHAARRGTLKVLVRI